jgi:Holliday junction resolvase
MHNFYPEDPLARWKVFYQWSRSQCVLKKMVDSPAVSCYAVSGEPEMTRDGQKKYYEGIKKKGDDAEQYFSTYLNDLDIPFYHIDSSLETHSENLKHRNIRRPDYIIHTKKGVFHIDVKSRTKLKCGEPDEKRFYLNQHEIEKLFNFENELYAPVWIAFTEGDQDRTFCYVPISKIYEFYTNLLSTYEEKYGIVYRNLSRKSRDFIFVPHDLLCHHLSFDRGFYDEHEKSFLEQEAEYHWAIKTEGKEKQEASK